MEKTTYFIGSMHSSMENSSLSIYLNSMLKKGHKFFSLTKIQPDFPSSLFDDYVDSLNELLKKYKTSFEECLFIDNFVPGGIGLVPRIYIIGSRDSKKTKTLIGKTNKLVELVGQCPEGPVLDGIDFGNKEKALEYKGFIKKIKKKGKKILSIGKGPIYYNKDEIEHIIELFLAPIYKYHRPADSL